MHCLNPLCAVFLVIDIQRFGGTGATATMTGVPLAGSGGSFVRSSSIVGPAGMQPPIRPPGKQGVRLICLYGCPCSSD